MRKTTFAGLTVLDPGEPLTTDGGSFLNRNPEITDHFLSLIKTHRHDGADPLADPVDAATLTTDATGGTLPPDVTVTAVYTLLDDQGGETLPSPVAAVTTASPVDPPQEAPTAIVDYTAGTLTADVYAYVLTLTDDLGGETTAGPVARVVRDPGSPTAQIALSGLTAVVAASPGATGWRLYRAKGSGDFDFLTAGVGDAFTDDGTTPLDCGVTPPDANTTNGANQVTLNVPVLPAGAVAFRIYVSTTGDFTSPSLLGTTRLPAEAGVDIVLGSIVTEDGAPPDVSTSIGGSALIVSGGGGGGSTFSYPADAAVSFTVDDTIQFARQRAYVGLHTDASEPTALLYSGNAYFSWPLPYTHLEPDAQNYPDLEYRNDFFVAEPAPGMRDGSTTIRFQVDALDVLGTIAAYIGQRGGLRTYGRLTFGGVGAYYLTVGTEEVDVEQTQDEAGFFDASAVALAADTDYWLRVTRDGTLLSAALYDVDPTATPAAVAIADVAPVQEATRAWDWTLRANAMPGFGWTFTDAAMRSGLFRVYDLAAHAETGGEGYDAADPPSRVAIFDNGSAYDPAAGLNFINFNVSDERPDSDRITITAPGLPPLGADGFTWAGALGGYLTQNAAVDNQDVMASAAGDDARVVLAPSPPTVGWLTVQARALFVGVAADDQLGVMVMAYDIDSYLLIRVDNATAAPVLEIVDVNNGVETVLASTPIDQLVTDVAANWWDTTEQVWVGGEHNNGYVGATVWTMRPDLDLASPAYQLGTKLPSAVAARYATEGAYGLTLVPAAAGANALRATELTAKGT